MKCRAKLDAAEGNSDLASEVESGKRKIRQPAEWTENETSESSDEGVNRRLRRPPKPFAGLLMHEGDVLHQQVRDRMDSDISREENINPNKQEDTFSVGSINMDGAEKTLESASQLNVSKPSITTNAGVNQVQETLESAADTGVNQVQETSESAADTVVNQVQKTPECVANTGVNQVQKTPECAADTGVNQVQKTPKSAADTRVNQIEKSTKSFTTTFGVNQVEKALDEMKPVSQNVRMSPRYSKITRLSPFKRKFNESHTFDTKRMKKTSESVKQLNISTSSSRTTPGMDWIKFQKRQKVPCS